MKISVIIPVLNERASLAATLAAISRAVQVADSPAEVIIVDGGSTDGTREWLEQQLNPDSCLLNPEELKAADGYSQQTSGIRNQESGISLPILVVLEAERGRGMQLRAGAKVATGDVLLFLHGDCLLPPDGLKLLTEALTDGLYAGGCFLIGFPEPASWSLRVIARGINARTRATRTGTGDQGIFVRREVYDAIGGFRAWPLFEDVDLVTRLKRRGKFAVLKSVITISPRRYLAHGPWRTTLLMYALRIGYWTGISPVKLREWFVDVRR
ncbi:MAG TPA: glycosyltransferase family 2 protein [Blastocatellia bacterium]|nr:glycosyltransferase family 2 protein [Blastocatellia bacterium]